MAEGRAVLGEKRFATAWAAGRAMPMEEVVAWALEQGRPAGGEMIQQPSR